MLFRCLFCRWIIMFVNTVSLVVIAQWLLCSTLFQPTFIRSRCHQCGSLVAWGGASGQNSSCIPDKSHFTWGRVQTKPEIGLLHGLKRPNYIQCLRAHLVGTQNQNQFRILPIIRIPFPESEINFSDAGIRFEFVVGPTFIRSRCHQCGSLVLLWFC